MIPNCKLNLKILAVDTLKMVSQILWAGNIVFVISGDFSKNNILPILKKRLSKALNYNHV